MSWIKILLGRRLANREQGERKLGVWAGVPALGLDALASSAYGPEAALTLLPSVGAAGPRSIGPITAVILVLLGLLYVSYRQTIAAYPNGGGSYTVAKENLGAHAGLLAAAALMLDYVLNVAVGISAGVGALVSAVPGLQPYTLSLCLLALALITLVNLRGVRESGLAFVVPTYLFVGSFFVLLGLGVARALLAGGHPRPVVPPPPLSPAAVPLSLWLLMRAFASGCTAMTGVEAVSNGVSAFREPAVTNAHRTLTAIIAILAVLLGGIAYLGRAYDIGAMDQTRPGYQSVLSQLTAAVVGRGAFYYVTIGSLLAVLALSANTSFVDFPRLCRLIARDGFLPTAFAPVGRRLVYSLGILVLAASSGLLLVVFGGITDRLIPLFAVGAFLAFTLSQAGMVVHWWREKGERGVRSVGRHLLVNGLGAATTAAALLVIVAAKFAEGAWITLLAIPSLILLFKRIRRYYDRVDREMREPRPLELGAQRAAGGGAADRGLEQADEQGAAVRHEALARGDRRPPVRARGERRGAGDRGHADEVERGGGAAGAPGGCAGAAAGLSAVAVPPVPGAPARLPRNGEAGVSAAHGRGHRSGADQTPLVAARAAQPAGAPPPDGAPGARGRARRGGRRAVVPRRRRGNRWGIWRDRLKRRGGG